MLRVKYNNKYIPDNLIKQINDPVSSAVGYNFKNIIASTVKIEMINNSEYDEDNSLSEFYGVWYNSIIEIYDDKRDEVYFKGRIKNIEKDTGSKTFKLTIKNFIKDIIDTKIYRSLSEDTPSNIIKSLLITDVGIPIEYLNESSFDEAHLIQGVNKLQLNYTSEDNVKVSTVIGEILRMTNSFLYLEENKICYHQVQKYQGDLGKRINSEDIINGTYKSDYSDEDIYNRYHIACSSGGGVGYTNESLNSYLDSINRYGEKIFNVPNTKIDSTEIKKYKILFNSSASAAFYGKLILYSSSELRKNVKFDTLIKRDDIKLNDVVDVTFNNLYSEPVRIEKKKKDNKKISFEGYFLNLSRIYIDDEGNTIVRDTTPPGNVTITDIIPADEESIFIVYKNSPNNIILGLKLYFTTTNNWSGESSSVGFSPLEIFSWEEISEGVYRIPLSGLTSDKEYSFKIKVFDQRYNESGDSNIFKFKF